MRASDREEALSADVCWLVPGAGWCLTKHSQNHEERGLAIELKKENSFRKPSRNHFCMFKSGKQGLKGSHAMLYGRAAGGAQAGSSPGTAGVKKPAGVAVPWGTSCSCLSACPGSRPRASET